MAGFILVLAALLGSAALPQVLSPYDTGLLSLALIYSIAAMGQTVLTGTANQPSVGNSAFMLIGAYASASLTNDLHLPLPLAAALAVGIAAMIGLVVGLPTLRIGGVYLAVATIALVFVVQEILTEWDTVAGRNGLPVTRPQWLGTDRGLYYASLLTAAVITVLLWNLLRSRIGRGWLAIRESETAATAVGIRPSLYKTLAFSVSAATTACAGVLLAQYDSGVTASAFGLPVSLTILSMAVIGGLGSLPGAYVGALLITLLPNLLGALPASIGSFQIHSSATLISALLLLLTLAFVPEGLWSVVNHCLTWVRVAAPLRKDGSKAPA